MEMAPHITSLIVGNDFKVINEKKKFSVLNGQTERAHPVVMDESGNQLAQAVRSQIPQPPVSDEAPLLSTADTSPREPSWKMPQSAMEYLKILVESADPTVKKKLDTLLFDVEDVSSKDVVVEKINMADYLTLQERNHLKNLVGALENVASTTAPENKIQESPLDDLRRAYTSELTKYKSLLRENKSKYSKVMAEFQATSGVMPEVSKPRELLQAEEAYLTLKKQLKIAAVAEGKFSVGAAVTEAEKERGSIRSTLVTGMTPLERGILAKALRV